MPTLRFTLLPGLLGLALLVVLPAIAETDATPNDASAVMARLDPDHDGTVSLDEVKKVASERFDALDTDHEGTLDASELTGILDQKGLQKADKDKDKTLDKAEFIALVTTYFQRADKDKDGKLEPAELNTPEGRALVALLGL
jgi:Ca2+-binding EF-hand superfamily protein